MKRIVFGIPRYLALVTLVVAVAIALPFAGLSKHMVDGLTREETYIELVRELGIGEKVRGIADKASALVHGIIPGGENTISKDALDPVNSALSRAIDDAVGRVVAQIPAYVAGRRDHFEADVHLDDVRRHLIGAAKNNLPGGRFLEGQITRGVEAAVPARVSLEAALSTLEAVCLPLRVVVVGLYKKIQSLRHAAFAGLAVIVLIAFRLVTAARFAGVAVCLAGVGGSWSAEMSQLLLRTVLPDAVLSSRLFQALISRSIVGFNHDARQWILIGGTLLVLSFVVPFGVKRIARGTRSCAPAPLLASLVPRGERTSLATVVALVPSLVAFLVARSSNRARRAARAALGGRMFAATLLDYTLFPLLIAGLGAGVTGWLGIDFLGGLAAAPLWLLLVLFWAVRDRPRTRRGVNLTDRLAGVVRAREPDETARFASLRRSVPLLAALLTGLFVPVHYAFLAVCGIELVALVVRWPDRTLGDLVAGTRGRLTG